MNLKFLELWSRGLERTSKVKIRTVEFILIYIFTAVRYPQPLLQNISVWRASITRKYRKTTFVSQAYASPYPTTHTFFSFHLLRVRWQKQKQPRPCHPQASTAWAPGLSSRCTSVLLIYAFRDIESWSSVQAWQQQPLYSLLTPTHFTLNITNLIFPSHDCLHA